MSAIKFTAVVGPDGAIRPPEGVALPQGEIDVSVRPRPAAAEALEERLRAHCARYGVDAAHLSATARTHVIENFAREDRGEPWQRPEPGALKGTILYMAPDFDAPLEDMREYME